MTRNRRGQRVWARRHEGVFDRQDDREQIVLGARTREAVKARARNDDSSAARPGAQGGAHAQQPGQQRGVLS
jgi:hypothetical protein